MASVKDALQRIQALHATAQPNSGFLQQLETFAKKMHVQPSVTDIVRCKHCRYALFTKLDTISHDPESSDTFGKKNFSFKKVFYIHNCDTG